MTPLDDFTITGIPRPPYRAAGNEETKFYEERWDQKFSDELQKAIGRVSQTESPELLCNHSQVIYTAKQDYQKIGDNAFTVSFIVVTVRDLQRLGIPVYCPGCHTVAASFVKLEFDVVCKDLLAGELDVFIAERGFYHYQLTNPKRAITCYICNKNYFLTGVIVCRGLEYDYNLKKLEASRRFHLSAGDLDI